VYYSSVLTENKNSEITLTAGGLSKGNHQYIEFGIDSNQVGGCEVHYLSDTTAYLRWIYVNGDIVGKGIGTKCMNALKTFLYEKGIRRFDTDTALDNKLAQHYYEKNSFTREGVTRSYYTKLKNCSLEENKNE
ncbi:MAG: GNAT family N-acetyltransferase, partial [Ruminococcus sp.]|nr:GNAT family N-acetyltransferase [Ruminococcus sp.]